MADPKSKSDEGYPGSAAATRSTGASPTASATGPGEADPNAAANAGGWQPELDRAGAVEIDDGLAAGAGGDEPAARAAGPAAAAPGLPLLDQDEIDSLLTFAHQGHRRKSCVSVLIDNSTVTYERLPMLEVVFDRLVRIMTTSLRNFTSENVEVTLQQIEGLRFSEYLESVSQPALLAVFRAMEWDNFGLITVDNPLIYSIVEVLLGGRRGTVPARVEGRPYTTIERNLIERLIGVVLHDMGLAFEPLSPVEFRLERLETNPRFAAIARPANGAILCRLRVEMEDRGGNLEVLVPYATLEPVRDLLLQMFMGEKFGQDSIWETHLAREMLATQVELEALLDQRMIPLGTVMRLKVGQTLPLAVRGDQPVTLRCGQVPLMRGQLGRSRDRIAVRIDGRIERDADQMEQAR